ncbi:MAG: gamma-glutamyltransferase family protein [Burkholderiales bacterium]
MAATSHPAATLTAIETLKDGGCAIDAAVAACAVQCVVEAGSTGVGGDCFALLSPQGSTDIRAYNGSGRAPAGASLAALRAAGLSGIPRHSPWSVTVPGAVEAWCRLVADHGTLPMSRILAPAIEMARSGYAITPRVAVDLAAEQALLCRDATARATFLDADGRVPGMGDVQSQPLLADTLEAIGREGARAFYAGPIAEDIVAHLRRHGGCHTREDFATARGEYVTPVSLAYRGRTIHECPPNGQGVIVLIILGILSRFELAGDSLDPRNLHLLIEASRLAYAARDALLADPATGTAASVADLLSDESLDRLAARIDLESAGIELPAFEVRPHRDTVYIAVVDRHRNAVSFINSLFDHYGSGLMAPRSGVLLHNRGECFSSVEGHPNAMAPGKRPLHTIIPGMVSQAGRVTMTFGVMGGHYQATGQAHFLSRLFDHALDLQHAIDLPRVFPLPGTTVLEAETALQESAGAALRSRGFSFAPTSGPIGGAQAIVIDWDKGTLLGASDHRKDGMALGY